MLLQSIDEVHEVRGAGLMRGVVLKSPIAFAVVAQGLQHGLVLNATSDSVLRLVPPLVISDGSLVEAVATLKTVIASVSLDPAATVATSSAPAW